MTECYRRFKHPVYLLTCELAKGHKGPHKDGKYDWGYDEGFDDEYTGAPIKYDPDRPPPEPDVVTLEEVVEDVPKFYDGVVKVSADKNGVFPAGSLDVIAKGNKTIAERLAERKALNASLNKKA